jgi:hypothetical protein
LNFRHLLFAPCGQTTLLLFFTATAMSRKVLGISTNELISIFSKPSGLQSHHNCFSVKAIPWKSSPVGLDPNKDLRVMFVAGKKKLGKLAIYRNRAQRRVKASVSEHFLETAPKGN